MGRNETAVRAGAMGLAAVYLALAAVVFQGVEQRVGEPFPGFFISTKGFLGQRMLALPEVGLRHYEAGFADRLVAVDGEVHRGASALAGYLGKLPAGTSVSYRFRRPGGESYEISVPVMPLPASHLWGGVLPLMLAGVLALLTGLLVAWARPGWGSARAFFFAGWASVLQLTVLPFDTFLEGRLLPASYAIGALFFGSVLHLSLTFPVRRWPLTRHPVLGAAVMYGTLALPWLWSAFSHGRPWVPLDTTVRGLYIPICYALCVPLLINTTATLWRRRDPAERRRARLVLPAALLLAALVPLSELWNDNRIPLVFRVAVSVICVSGMGIVVALATLKHDMLELGGRVRQALARVSLVAAVVVAYVALHAAVQRWAGMGSSWATGVVAGLLVVALVMSLAPLRQRLEQRVEDLFFPGQRRARELLRRVSLEFADLRNPEGVVPVVRRAVEERVGRVRILVGRSEEPLRELSPRPASPPLSDRDLEQIRGLLASRKRLVVPADTAAPPRERGVLARLRELGVDLLVPLPAGRAVGGFLLETTSPGSSPPESDLLLLDTLAAQSAIALENAAAWEEVRRLQRRLEEEDVCPRLEIWEGEPRSGIVGSSPALRGCLEDVQAVASTSATVLIEGETGTGKELVALAIHEASSRRERRLVKVACAAIPEALFESELFGHERGAFTGAGDRKIGRFELAHDGTLFLDDVDALPLAVQAKLLRAAQEGEVQRLGSNELRRVDVRIVAATNKVLAEEVRAGRFREDLFYRLNVVPIRLPALRDRREDVPLLVQYFLAREAEKHRREIEGISRAALDEMLRYSWPGNVRELHNVIERAVVLSRGPRVSLPGPLGGGAPLADPAGAPVLGDGFRLEDELLRYKRALIEQALERVGGNHRRAAALLGLQRSSLTRMVHRLGVTSPGP